MKQKSRLLLIVIVICHMACTDRQKIPQHTPADIPNTHIDSVAKKLYMKAKYYESASLYKQIYIAAKSSQDQPREAYAYEQLGNIATRQGQLEDALSWYFQAHRIYQVLRDTLSMAWINNYVGYVYVLSNQPDKGMYYYQNAKDLAATIGDSVRTRSLYGMLYMNISGVELARKNYKKFFQEAFLSLKYLQQDSVNFAINYNNLGLAYKGLGEYDKAKYWLEKGLDIYVQVGDRKQLSMIYANLGLIYVDQGSYAKAENYLLRAMDLATQMGSLSSQRNRHLDFAHLYQKTGRLKLAFEHFTMAYDLSEQMFSEDAAKKSAEMEAQYGLGLKQKEIQINRLELSKKQKENNYLIVFLALAGFVIIIVVVSIILLVRSTKQIREANKSILESLRYARHIQLSLLPTETQIQCMLPDSFVFYVPKAFISGDFYWMKRQGDNILFAVGDCTGHGVPAALLSMLGFRMLDECIREVKNFRPDFVVNYLNKKMALAFSTQQEERREGMEIIVCKLNTRTLSLEYAGSNLSLYVVHNNDIDDLRTDRFTLGQREMHKSTKYTIQLDKNQIIYLASDGYPTQFGGPKDKKYSKKRFKELLFSVSGHPMDHQQKLLRQNLKQWNNAKNGQTDDILVLGIRV